MIMTVLAIIGAIEVASLVAKGITRVVLRAEHENDRVQYQIIENGQVIWESGFVDEFTMNEHNAFSQFCNEWAKHPGSTAKWDRIKK